MAGRRSAGGPAGYARQVPSARLHGVLGLLVCLSLLSCQAGESEPSQPGGPASPAGGTASPVALPTGATEEIREQELAIAEGVNDERQAQGLATLEWRGDLARVAREYSRRMLDEGFFDHVSPEGESIADRVRDAGITFTAVGENLYQGDGPLDHVSTAVDGWMDSPGHRENILREVFTQTGVGLARQGDRVIATQIFLTP